MDTGLSIYLYMWYCVYILQVEREIQPPNATGTARNVCSRLAPQGRSKAGGRPEQQGRSQAEDRTEQQERSKCLGRPEPQGRSQAGGRTEQQGARNGLAAQNRRDTRNAEAAQSSKALEMARPPFSLYIHNIYLYIYKQKLSTE